MNYSFNTKDLKLLTTKQAESELRQLKELEMILREYLER
jgi:hypothetical protein